MRDCEWARMIMWIYLWTCDTHTYTVHDGPILYSAIGLVPVKSSILCSWKWVCLLEIFQLFRSHNQLALVQNDTFSLFCIVLNICRSLNFRVFQIFNHVQNYFNIIFCHINHSFYALTTKALMDNVPGLCCLLYKDHSLNRYFQSIGIALLTAANLGRRWCGSAC